MPPHCRRSNRSGITKLKQNTLATNPIGDFALIFIETLLINRIIHWQNLHPIAVFCHSK
jgi:hypothetical protein